jgi:hypothetical protein
MRALFTGIVLHILVAVCSQGASAVDTADPDSISRDEPRPELEVARFEADEPVTKQPLQPSAERPGEGAAETCREPSQCRCFPRFGCQACPCFYGEVEALLFQQVPLQQNRPIVVDPNVGVTYLSSSNLDSGFDPGLRAMFGARLCNGLAIEVGYFGLYQEGYSLVQKPSDTSFLIFPGNLAGNVFVNMNRVQADYSSSISSVELNFAACCGCCARTECAECGGCGGGQQACDDCGPKLACGRTRCSSLEWFAGIRYFDIGDNLNLDVQRLENGGVENGNYSVHATNHLIGAQLGARLRHTFNRFGWELAGKAGAYANDAAQTQYVLDFPNFPLRPETSAQSTVTAFVGEINISGIYRLTDVWSAKAGYNVIWIEGVALAADQLDFNFATSPSGNQLYPHGGLLLHGVNLGLEARW